ncbi:MAG: SIR2 family protein [Ignavibacteriae bacterium]|nr:SIR2 family protein [Ignavibacteriota bacterium]
MENLLEILATPKQVGLLIGAGVSKACGLPNVDDLTKEVLKVLKNKNFTDLLSDDDNIEDILNKVQQLKSLISKDKEFNNLKEKEIIEFEKSIKKTIFGKLSTDVVFDKLCNLVIWLNFINREFEKEIFSLNYDLLLEKALEKVNLPYFSGFVGNLKPFFISDSVDDFKGLYVKQSWVKLWKLHGSLNFKKSKDEKIFIENNVNNEFENLLVYPSMDKYLSSRKAPFISYLDRFRKYLLENEKVLLILGYSFNDDHVNDIIINGLNNNTRLTVLTFTYSIDTFKRVIEIFGLYPNISIYTEKKKYINKAESEFTFDKNIGDFNNFVTILDLLVNQKPLETIIETEKEK